MLIKDFFDFIDTHWDENPDSLRLRIKKGQFPFDTDLAITQIECRKKYSAKLKNFLSNPFFLFPDSISGEQSSHQAIAKFHASLIASEQKIIDMTAGLGIDSFSMANRDVDVLSIELNEIKAKILKHNVEILNLNNVKVINSDSMEFLKQSDTSFDLIFVDPARRDSKNNRVYNLRHCSPDILTYQDLLFKHSPRILIKASPLLDISQSIKDFPNLYSVKAIGVKGECKEILIELKRDFQNLSNPPKIEAINLNSEGEVISLFSDVTTNDNSCSEINIEEIKEGAYILEPSAMVMKLSPWKSLCARFNAKKFGPSSHLFITNELPKDFPGRVSKLQSIIKSKDRKSLNGFPASVVSRNHPMKADEIRKSFNLLEGDKYFIYASRIGNKPIMILAQNLYPNDKTT